MSENWECDSCGTKFVKFYAISAAQKETREQDCRAACVQCGRDIEVEMREGFWRHVYMDGGEARCLSDAIRKLPPLSEERGSGPPPTVEKRECKETKGE